MLAVGDALDAFYLGSFLFGLLFAAGSQLLGAAHLRRGSHGHGSRAVHGFRASAEHVGIGPVNFASALAGVSSFRGVGDQGGHAQELVTPLSLLCTVRGGLLGAAIARATCVRIAVPNDVALDPDEFRLEGMLARASPGIRGGGTGETVHERLGVQQVSAVPGVDGAVLPRGVESVVLRFEGSVALVQSTPPSIAVPATGIGPAGGAPHIRTRRRDVASGMVRWIAAMPGMARWGLPMRSGQRRAKRCCR